MQSKSVLALVFGAPNAGGLWVVQAAAVAMFSVVHMWQNQLSIESVSVVTSGKPPLR